MEMRYRVVAASALVLASAVGVGSFLARRHRVVPPNTQISTGKYITPYGTNTEVGSYPANMAVSPDGKYVLVTNTGFKEQLSVLDSKTGALVDKMDFNQDKTGAQLSLYYGLAFDRDGKIFASNGPMDRVTTLHLTDEGKLAKDGELLDPSLDQDRPNFIAGLALSSDHSTLYTAHNEAYRQTGMTSSLSVIDVASGRVKQTIKLPGFPLAVAAITEGDLKDKKVYATCEMDGVVACIDPVTGAVTTIRTGMQPSGLTLNKAQTKLYVSNSGSDTISIIDTARDKVVKTILTRPAALRGLPGSTPIGLALSDDEHYLYVALGDMNAVGVIDLQKNSLIGYLPAGWYPTSVAVVGNNLFVANAKGVRGRNPNGPPLKGSDAYIQNVLEGTVAMIDMTDFAEHLPDATQQVLMNNFAIKGEPRLRTAGFKNPGIKHVIYILKENRTYDQVLGDIPRGNGDPTLTLFGKDITPNQHALAERFVLLDNFSVCAEVSADGWQWSTAGITSAYTSRNVPFNYSGRGRDYDFEGQTNGVATDLTGGKDVAEAPGGYIWDACLRQHVSFRNYGFYVDPIDSKEAQAGGIEIADNGPTKKALVKYTDQSFRQFDMSYADSDLWNLYQSPEPKQLKEYGNSKSQSRFTEWKKEFDQMVATNKMPQFMMVRFCRDHTAGTTPGLGSPQAMVADNDYSVGQLVDAVSHSPFWKDTAIFILEDDAQAGHDHVDCHRTTAYVISPFVKRGFEDSRFYNTDSFLRTMELILGLKPMNQYDATANYLDIFDKGAANDEPYSAVMPSREIATAVNTPKAYRANDSEKLVSLYHEADYADLQLNDILWHAMMGTAKPTNAAPRPTKIDPDGDGD